MNLDFEATASYYCEVSIDNPIFTKASSEEQLHIIGKWIQVLKGNETLNPRPLISQSNRPALQWSSSRSRVSLSAKI